jgi:hypothetical protein
MQTTSLPAGLSIFRAALATAVHRRTASRSIRLDSCPSEPWMITL